MLCEGNGTTPLSCTSRVCTTFGSQEVRVENGMPGPQSYWLPVYASSSGYDCLSPDLLPSLPNQLYESLLNTAYTLCTTAIDLLLLDFA